EGTEYFCFSRSSVLFWTRFCKISLKRGTCSSAMLKYCTSCCHVEGVYLFPFRYWRRVFSRFSAILFFFEGRFVRFLELISLMISEGGICHKEFHRRLFKPLTKS